MYAAVAGAAFHLVRWDELRGASLQADTWKDYSESLAMLVYWEGVWPVTFLK